MFLKCCGRKSQSLKAIKHRSICPELFCKKGVLEISQNSEENTCARASFLIKLQASGLIEHFWWLILKAIATLISVGKASWNQVPCFSRLFLTKGKLSINVSGVIEKSALNYCLMARSFLLFHMCETIALLGERSKPFFHLSNQWSTMQYLKFVSKKIFFLIASIYRLLFLRGFWRLLINCLNSRSKFSFITAYFSLQLSLNSSLFKLNKRIFFTENPFIYLKN